MDKTGVFLFSKQADPTTEQEFIRRLRIITSGLKAENILPGEFLSLDLLPTLGHDSSSSTLHFSVPCSGTNRLPEFIKEIFDQARFEIDENFKKYENEPERILGTILDTISNILEYISPDPIQKFRGSLGIKLINYIGEKSKTYGSQYKIKLRKIRLREKLKKSTKEKLDLRNRMKNLYDEHCSHMVQLLPGEENRDSVESILRTPLNKFRSGIGKAVGPFCIFVEHFGDNDETGTIYGIVKIVSDPSKYMQGILAEGSQGNALAEHLCGEGWTAIPKLAASLAGEENPFKYAPKSGLTSNTIAVKIQRVFDPNIASRFQLSLPGDTPIVIINRIMRELTFNCRAMVQLIKATRFGGELLEKDYLDFIGR